MQSRRVQKDRLRAFLRRYAVDCLFAVGPNLGQYHNLIRDEVGVAGPIVSFEPVTQSDARLKTLAAADKHWSVFDYALGSAESMAVSTSPGLRAFLSPRRDVGEGFWQDEAGIDRPGASFVGAVSRTRIRVRRRTDGGVESRGRAARERRRRPAR